MSLTIELGASLEAFVDEAVADGRYASPTELLQDGVRMLQAREREQEALRRLLQPAIDEMNAGGGRDMDEVFDELLAELDAKIAAHEGVAV